MRKLTTIEANEERFPLCTATNQPICNAFIERDLEESLSGIEIVELKRKLNVKPSLFDMKKYRDELNRAIQSKIDIGEPLTPKDIFDCTLQQDLPGEVWKDIARYEGYYQISNIGQVKSCPRINCNGEHVEGRIMALNENRDGYTVIYLCKDGSHCTCLMHRLVAEAFIPKTEEDIRLGRDVVNHKNHIRIDNRVENLEWCTLQENTIDAARLGYLNKKITDEDVRCLVELYKSGLYCADIAKLSQFSHLARKAISNAIFRHSHKDNSKDVDIPKRHRQKHIAKPIELGSPRCRFTLLSVIEAKLRFSAGESARSIARDYKIDHHSILTILHSKRFSHITEDAYPNEYASVRAKLGL